MFRRFKELVVGWLQQAPPFVLLSIPFLLCGSIAIFLLLTLPLAGTVKYFFFAALFGAVLFSRMLQAWEFGIECYHFIIFCFAFTYGPVAGILFSVASSLIVVFSAIFMGGHMFNHSVPGPVFQSLELFLLSIIAGLLGVFAHDFTLQHLPYLATFLAACTFALHLSMTRKYVGVETGRLASADVVSIMVNYNLFTSFGPQLIEQMANYV